MLDSGMGDGGWRMEDRGSKIVVGRSWILVRGWRRFCCPLATRCLLLNWNLALGIWNREVGRHGAMPGYLEMPGGAHGLVDEAVGFVVADGGFGFGVEVDGASGADGDVGEVEEAGGVVAGVGVAAGLLAGFDGLAEAEEFGFVGEGVELLPLFFC